MRARIPLLTATAPILLLLAGCFGSAPEHAPRAAAPTPRLRPAGPCPDSPGFACSQLRVALDRHSRQGGTLALRVAVRGSRDAPRGVLLTLTGGPGQPGEPYGPKVLARLGPLAADYRLVLIDQRGTGEGALDCPALQEALGASDLTAPPPGAVEACARALGPRRAHFATADTVADLEDLRRALGARRLVLDGTSYGSFVAERYALAHPARVSRLVLDSVVPHTGVDPLRLPSLPATARVLRAVCAARRCPGDPARNLATVIRKRHLGVALLDALTGLSVGAPDFPGVPEALHAAAHGDPGPLRRLLAGVHDAEAVHSGQLSQGLHASTLCLDDASPWGGPAAPLAARGRALRRAAARLGVAALGPYDSATATDNGLTAVCRRWPPVPAPATTVARNLPPVPVLLLAGARDLSTPLAWAREEAARAPRARLLVLPHAGHSVRSRGPDTARARRVMRAFLHGG